MKNNIGLIDKVLRSVIGLGLISLVFIGPKTVWGWIGLVPLATVLISWCPLYSIVGVSSKGKETAS